MEGHPAARRHASGKCSYQSIPTRHPALLVVFAVHHRQSFARLLVGNYVMTIYRGKYQNKEGVRL